MAWEQEQASEIALARADLSNNRKVEHASHPAPGTQQPAKAQGVDVLAPLRPFYPPAWPSPALCPHASPILGPCRPWGATVLPQPSEESLEARWRCPFRHAQCDMVANTLAPGYSIFPPMPDHVPPHGRHGSPAPGGTAYLAYPGGWIYYIIRDSTSQAHPPPARQARPLVRSSIGAGSSRLSSVFWLDCPQLRLQYHSPRC